MAKLDCQVLILFNIETFDSSRSKDLKFKKILELIKKSKYIVVFTGAGISTSSGISGFYFF